MAEWPDISCGAALLPRRSRVRHGGEMDGMVAQVQSQMEREQEYIALSPGSQSWSWRSCFRDAQPRLSLIRLHELDGRQCVVGAVYHDP